MQNFTINYSPVKTIQVIQNQGTQAVDINKGGFLCFQAIDAMGFRGGKYQLGELTTEIVLKKGALLPSHLAF